MPVTAIEMWNRAAGRHPWLSKTSKGFYGARFFQADTIDPAEAVLALGLPALGTPFSAATELADCVLTSIKTECQGGRDTATQKGLTYIDLEYQPRTVAPIDAVAELNQAYSEMTSSAAQARVRSDSAGAVRVPETSKEVHTVELVVRAYKASLSPLASWVGIMGKINSNSVAIPPVRGLPGSGFTATAGQLIARTFGIRPVRDGLIEISYTLGYGPAGSFLFRYQPEDQNGNPTGAAQTADIQGTTAYPLAGVLW